MPGVFGATYLVQATRDKSVALFFRLAFHGVGDNGEIQI